jgi:hypothetical protein
MTSVCGSIEIRRPVEEVFDFVADQRNELSYNPKTTESVKLTEGSDRGRSTISCDGASAGKRLPMVIEYTGSIGRREERSIWTGLQRYLEGKADAP